MPKSIALFTSLLNPIYRQIGSTDVVQAIALEHREPVLDVDLTAVHEPHILATYHLRS